MSIKLGIVGVGSIGFELITALRLTAQNQVAAILLIILACAVVLYSLGTILKRRLE
jgi:phosphonate transport system permease protein